jgi:hypothetical protein
MNSKDRADAGRHLSVGRDTIRDRTKRFQTENVKAGKIVKEGQKATNTRASSLPGPQANENSVPLRSPSDPYSSYSP